jgi:hypothetical protein
MNAVTVLVGTTKGAFLISSGDDRKNWKVSGPFCGGWPINHVVAEAPTGTIWAGGGGEWHGAGIWRSEDNGQNWALSKLSRGKMDEWAENDAGFAAMMGWSDPKTKFDGAADAVWSLAYDGATLYAGCKPGRLYASNDKGANWEPVEGFNNHPDRESWNPGAVGLTLHSIVIDRANPAKIWLGVSAAGVFASEDGGKHLKAATGFPMRRPAFTMTTLQRRAMAKRASAFIISGNPSRAMCSISKTIMAFTKVSMAGAAGTM